MSITIERKNGYWKARESSSITEWKSVDGRHWITGEGLAAPFPLEQRLQGAFFNHLDTTAEPQRAKVGQLVRITGDHNSVANGTTWEVVESNEHAVFAYRDETKDMRWGFKHGTYIIVPEPVPAPKTYTRNPKDWGEGVYTNGAGGDVVVIVDRCGKSIGVAKDGMLFTSDRDYCCKYHRISTDPAAAVRKCFGAISGKGGE